MSAKYTRGVVVGICLGIVLISTAPGCNSQNASQPITVSQETTHFVAPLDNNGDVDYSAAMHEALSRGITPDNNAGVDLVRALGPTEGSDDDTFYERLGIEPLPEHGDYLIGWADFLTAKTTANEPVGEQVHDQWRLATSRSWSQHEFPLLAEWVRANDKPLATLVAGLDKPRFYVPHLSKPNGMLAEALLPYVNDAKEATRLLLARAMLKLNGGQTDDAFDDLLACRRLAHLLGQGGGFAVEALMGFVMNRQTAPAFAALAREGSLTSDQAIAFRRRLNKIPRPTRVSESIDLGERCTGLDTIQHCNRAGVGTLRMIAGSAAESERDWLSKFIDDVSRAPVDWNEACRVCNAWYDRTAEAMRLPTHAERRRNLDEIDAKINEWRGKLREGQITHQIAGRRFAHAVLVLSPLTVLEVAETENRVNNRLVELAFSLAAYTADHEAHPQELADLVPRYHSSVPQDPFTGHTLLYKRTASGYRLYSAGPNGIDDGGVKDGRKERTGADDIALLVPAAGTAQ